jgi:hypothetical protein
VGLAAVELERAGVTTVAIQFMRETAADARPPRALFAPFRYGFPADPANEPGRLLRIMHAALDMAEGVAPGAATAEHDAAPATERPPA